MVTAVPAPPLELIDRTGPLSPSALAGSSDALLEAMRGSRWWSPDDPVASYDDLGAELAAAVRATLPPDWSWEGKRVLDFGCGAGRVLRHLLEEARVAEIHGCDIDEPSIRWLRSHLSPPLHVLQTGETPPLPFEDGSFDLIYAISVYTHLKDSGSSWLADHRRLLREGGLLLASFNGPAVYNWWSEDLAPWDQEREGMKVYYEGAPWDIGGPAVFHTPSWIREHWGGAFAIELLLPDGLGFRAGEGQGWALLRKPRAA